jgi:hypothetical protein
MRALGGFGILDEINMAKNELWQCFMQVWIFRRIIEVRDMINLF